MRSRLVSIYQPSYEYESYHDEPNRYGVRTPSDKSSSEKHEALAQRGVAVAEQAVYAMVVEAAVERQQKDLGPSY